VAGTSANWIGQAVDVALGVLLAATVLTPVGVRVAVEVIPGAEVEVRVAVAAVVLVLLGAVVAVPVGAVVLLGAVVAVPVGAVVLLGKAVAVPVDVAVPVGVAVSPTTTWQKALPTSVYATLLSGSG
jgi:hypothetical protein